MDLRSIPDKTLKRISVLFDFIADHPYASISLVGLLVSFPIILFGLPAASHDAVFHAFYFKNFSLQFASGEIYPRWLNLINGGLGGPTFFYYQAAPFYFAFLFKAVPVSIMQQLGLASAGGIILSGITTVLWLREIAPPRPALLAAVIFLLMPYPVGYDVYVRAAFGEAFTFVLIPLILFFTVRISREGRLAIVGLAISYGLLCMTHLPVTLIFSGIPFLYILLLSNKEHRLRHLAAVVGAMVLGAGLASVYIIPAVAYQDYAYLNELREGSYSFKGWLMTTQLTVYGSMEHFWMPVTVCILAIPCFIVGYDSRLGKNKRREVVFWMFILASSFFMMLQISSPIWESITYLQALQFPFRFNLLISIAALPLIALAVTAIRRPVRWYSLVFILFLTYFSYSWAVGFYKVASNAFNAPAEWKIAFDADMNRLGLETHARWPRTVPGDANNLDKSLTKIPLVGEQRAQSYIPAANGTVSVLDWRPRKIDLHVEAPVETTVNVSQFYFPGWTARVAGSTENLPVVPSQDLGLISITVPPGNHDVYVTLEALWPEYIAGWISTLSALITAGLFIWMLKKKRSTEI